MLRCMANRWSSTILPSHSEMNNDCKPPSLNEIE